MAASRERAFETKNSTMGYDVYGSVYSSGHYEWVDKETRLHRDEDLPAVIYPGEDCQWFFHGRRHRLYGYAVIFMFSDGGEWWVNGKRYFDEKDFLDACDAYRKKHGTYMSGRLTKRATPT